MKPDDRSPLSASAPDHSKLVAWAAAQIADGMSGTQLRRELPSQHAGLDGKQYHKIFIQARALADERRRVSKPLVRRRVIVGRDALNLATRQDLRKAYGSPRGSQSAEEDSSVFTPANGDLREADPTLLAFAQLAGRLWNMLVLGIPGGLGEWRPAEQSGRRSVGLRRSSRRPPAQGGRFVLDPLHIHFFLTTRGLNLSRALARWKAMGITDTDKRHLTKLVSVGGIKRRMIVISDKWITHRMSD